MIRAGSPLGAVMFVICILTCALAAFGCGPGYDAPTTGPPAIANASTEDQTCSRDAECVLVQDCCGCERHGRQLAVHRDRVEALQSAAPAECGDITCPVGTSEHRSCHASSARCLGGRCVPSVD